MFPYNPNEIKIVFLPHFLSSSKYDLDNCNKEDGIVVIGGVFQAVVSSPSIPSFFIESDYKVLIAPEEKSIQVEAFLITEWDIPVSEPDECKDLFFKLSTYNPELIEVPDDFFKVNHSRIFEQYNNFNPKENT